MQWLRIFQRRQWDDERARELEGYLEQETTDNLARGMNPQQARAAAQRKLGNGAAIREEIYRMNSLGLLETVWQDMRYAARGLRRNLGFTLVALLSLALGIGATTAIFSVVYGVLISPYPYARPAEIWSPEIHDLKHPQQFRSFHHMREFVELKKLPAFQTAMATSPGQRLLTGDRPPENFRTVALTGNAFSFLGVAAALGRTIQPSDFRADGQPEPVVVLSDKAWRRLFDRSPAALGKSLVLDDQPFTVIGVMPPRFGWWTDDGGWIPLPEDGRDNHMVAGIVRLRPGVSPQVATDQLQAFHLRLSTERPGDFPKSGFSTTLANYLDITVASGEMQSSLQLLFGAVGFLLLIACANVANLQLARGTSRAHEISLRMAIGAGRARLFRQLLTESVVLSVVGGAVGIVLAVGITRAIVLLIPASYVPNEARIAVNNYVLLFSACTSILTGILFGLAPALKSSRPDLIDALKDAGRTAGGSRGGARTRNALVVAEIALSVVLLMGASLTIRGFVQLQTQDVGFRADRVLMVGLQLPPKRYATYDQRVAFASSVLSAASSIPGVQSAAVGNGGFPFGGARSTYSIQGQPKEDSKSLLVSLVSAGYAQTMGIPLRAGRELTPQEVAHAESVAVINEAAARLWPAGISPIGAHLRLDVLDQAAQESPGSTPISPIVTVAGVIGNTRNDGLRNPTLPAAYLPYTLVGTTGRTLAVRTQSAPMLVLNAVRERIRGIDKDQPLTHPITLGEILDEDTEQPRFNVALFTFFGLLGLALAVVGIYSMLSYTVARRSHEIGIRMALGAARGDVVRQMLAMGVRLVLAGLAVGLGGSIALARYLQSQVFKIPSTDPLAMAGVAVVLSGAALLACLVPARRAANLNPMSALRHD